MILSTVIEYDSVISACEGSTDLGEVLYKLGIEGAEEEIALDKIEEIDPIVNLRLRKNLASKEMAEASVAGNMEAVSENRLIYLRITDEIRQYELEYDSTENSDTSVVPGAPVKLESTFDSPQGISPLDESLLFDEYGGDDEEEVDVVPGEGGFLGESGESGESGRVELEHSVDMGEPELSLVSEIPDQGKEDGMSISEEAVVNSVKKLKKPRSARRPRGSRDVSVEELLPVPAKDVCSAATLGDILGYTGEIYRGRKVVLFRKRPEAFGCKPLKRESKVRLTLHNGILNHMEIGDLSRAPTPYWAVLDASSDLKDGFTTEQVLSRALTLMGDDNQLEAIRIAWYVLKSHQTHPKQNYRGMSFIYENSKKSGAKLLSIRGRLGSETFEYFDKARVERKAIHSVEEKPVVMAVLDEASDASDDVGEEVPLATHVISHAR